MSDSNGVPRHTLPPIVKQSVFSEHLIIAAVLIENKQKDAAHLVLKRIQQLAQGAPVTLMEPNEFKQKMEIATTAMKYLR